ncbi:hypothetical protein Aoki45_11900 [Algoriphagus sp. oki45]|nr:hypothetical protein Aoki45_11900 [Algoriphagus sp. oki45]
MKNYLDHQFNYYLVKRIKTFFLINKFFRMFDLLTFNENHHENKSTSLPDSYPNSFSI